jgi:hypothetical protein
MTINEDAMEKMRAFVNNPCNETFTKIPPLNCMGCLVEHSRCLNECPGRYGRYTRICYLDQLEWLWHHEGQAQVVLYITQLIAYAESYVGCYP